MTMCFGMPGCKYQLGKLGQATVRCCGIGCMPGQVGSWLESLPGVQGLLLPAGKGPFPLCIPLLVLLGFGDCMNAFLKDLQSSCARCGKPGSCSGELLEQPFPSCAHHIPPDLALGLLLQVPGGEAEANSCGFSVGYQVLKDSKGCRATLGVLGPPGRQENLGGGPDLQGSASPGCTFRSPSTPLALPAGEWGSWIKSSSGGRTGRGAGAAEELLVLSHRCFCFLPRPALLVHPLHFDEGSKGHCCAGQTRSNYRINQLLAPP